jgi:hypothetical protein
MLLDFRHKSKGLNLFCLSALVESQERNFGKVGTCLPTYVEQLEILNNIIWFIWNRSMCEVQSNLIKFRKRAPKHGSKQIRSHETSARIGLRSEEKQNKTFFLICDLRKTRLLLCIASLHLLVLSCRNTRVGCMWSPLISIPVQFYCAFPPFCRDIG